MNLEFSKIRIDESDLSSDLDEKNRMFRNCPNGSMFKISYPLFSYMDLFKDYDFNPPDIFKIGVKFPSDLTFIKYNDRELDLTLNSWGLLKETNRTIPKGIDFLQRSKIPVSLKMRTIKPLICRPLDLVVHLEMLDDYLPWPKPSREYYK